MHPYTIIIAVVLCAIICYVGSWVTDYQIRADYISKVPVLGIMGNKYSGKDTTANYICERYRYHRIAFADPIKQICRILFSFNNDQLDGKLKEKPDPRWFYLKPRTVYQFVGTDLFRNNMNKLSPEFSDKFWIICAGIKIRESIDSNRPVIVSDVRFPNEYDMVKSMNGITIKISRPALQNDDTHTSENQIMTPDYEIINDGSINDLYDKIDSLMDQLLKNHTTKQTNTSHF